MKNFKKIPFKQILEDMSGNDIDKSKLEKHFKTINTNYKNTVEEYLAKLEESQNRSEIIEELKAKIIKTSNVKCYNIDKKKEKYKSNLIVKLWIQY